VTSNVGQSALAFSKWKFNPATDKNGKPTKMSTAVQVQFTWQSHEKH
jgi:hypothetical protein